MTERYGMERMHMSMTSHLTRWGARRARRHWMKSMRGRDAYVRHHGPMDYSVRYIDPAAFPNKRKDQDR
jgi:hypothetical protein